MALCSLSTGSSATPRARAARVTSSPAMTSTSLFASAMVLPASIAASTASSAVVPDEAHSRMSTSGCVATSISPSRAADDPRPGWRGRRQRRRRGRIADGGKRRPVRWRPAPRARRRCVPAASATTCSRSGCASIDRQGAGADGAGRPENRDALHHVPCEQTRRRVRRPESPAAARRCGRARRRGRE